MKLNRINSLPPILREYSLVQNMAKGQRLFRKGDRADYLYLIQQGRFQEISYPDDKTMTVLQILNQGDTLGEISLLFDNYSSTAIAKVDSQVVAYPKAILLETLNQYPLLMVEIITILCQKIYELQMRLEWHNISLADRRVLEYLNYQLQKITRNNQEQSLTSTVILDAPLQEIAAELGFVPGTLSRALAKLEAEQKISRNKNQITLHDDVA